MQKQGLMNFPVKVEVNRKLQKFMRGFCILYLNIEVSTVSFAILYCRAKPRATITENFIAILCSYARI